MVTRPFQVAPGEGAWDEWSAVEIIEACGLQQWVGRNVTENWPGVYTELAKLGLASRRSCAAAIATIAIETASTFAPVREAFWLDEAWRKANLRYWPFYGRGYIQLTWDYNYRRVETASGVDLVDEPDRALEPWIAAKIFAWYWSTHNIQAAADREDWPSVRRLVQGGSAGLPRLEQIVHDLLA